MNDTQKCFAFIGTGVFAKIVAALLALVGFFSTYSNAFAGASFCIGGIVGLRTLWLSFKKKNDK